jgi:hypothetical protein
MNSVNFAVGFTLMFCISLFLGWDMNAVAFKQAALIFAGFCLGGVVILMLEEL